MQKVIIQKMKEKNLSQNQLAKLVGVKQQYISKFLLGKVKSPGFNFMIRIADALDIDLNDLR
ncbi:helix-turn-helix domain-containing protein [Lactococcus raffinolactis]|uniref:helix-turn-helix domain-containing protein n=1 Tax=Pseudolactococcus raffinolactis TaxID=1366 RepID=UPI001436B3CE|nr:helix-turn-helix transcriptional regulator [Lactococcus raffinolactis]QIW51198.1 helix-turn-helix domain-containing protein [Lactococcus raffinolactis]